jgi:ubiquitin thioesterase OTU1
MSITIQIRHPRGVKRDLLPVGATLSDLKGLAKAVSGIEVLRQILKSGYPPKLIQASDHETLESLGIRSGETIIVEEGPSVEPSQLRDSEGKVMLRRVIASDNSCLFNSVGYALEGRQRNAADDLRSVIAGFVTSDPETYSEAMLGKPNPEYCGWIMLKTSWGGAIELSILSQTYGVEIAAISIQNLHVDVFGEGLGLPSRVYVLYDGIHYDVIARNTSEDAPEASDITVFRPDDPVALEGALYVAAELKKKKAFTDVSSFAIRCGVCYEGFKGQREAVKHCEQTGHTNFQEVNSP